MANCIILTTWGGRKYGRKIGKELRKFGVISYYCSLRRWPDVLKDHPELNKNNTKILVRAAHPNNSPKWMQILSDLEEDGWEVINSVKTLQLTSNKLKCSLFLQDKISHPKSWEVNKENFTRNWINNLPKGKYVIKPYVSQSQGKYVKIFTTDILNPEVLIQDIPERKLVVQEFIEYTALYRVIVINGKALPYSFVDKPTKDKWKVSVCLNKTTMEYVPNPSPELLKLGEDCQKLLGGKINYIDIFETKNGYVISEINTSCILSIHERLSGKNIAKEIAKGVL